MCATVLPFRAQGWLTHESSVGSEPWEDMPINKTAPLTCHVHSAAGWARDPGHLRGRRWGVEAVFSTRPQRAAVMDISSLPGVPDI